jgi:acyl carrier protein
MRSQEQVLSEMQRVFDDVFLDPVVLTPELSATDVPEWDSLLQVSLVVAIERHFQIRFRVGEVEATQNVGQFAALIGRRLSGE